MWQSEDGGGGPLGGPLVTVITPSFNQGKYIERTILSVAAERRTYPFIEHVIVDGASRDNTLEVLEKYSASIRWISEPDRGFAEAVNKGLALAKGEIVGIQSSDDLYVQGAVRKAVGALAERPEAGMIFGHFATVDEEDRILSVSNPFPPFDLEDYLTLEYVIPQPSVFFRLEVAKTVGGLDLDVDYVADMDLWLRIASRFPVVTIPECLSYVRLHKSSRNSTSTQFGRHWLKAVDRALHQGGICFRDARRRGNVYAAAALYDALYEAFNGQRTEALKRGLRACAFSPLWVMAKRKKHLVRIVYHLLIPKRWRKLVSAARSKRGRRRLGLGSVEFEKLETDSNLWWRTDENASG